MQAVILGLGSPLPDPDRAGPSTLVRTNAGDLLFDCGRAVLMRAAAVGSAAGASFIGPVTQAKGWEMTPAPPATPPGRPTRMVV